MHKINKRAFTIYELAFVLAIIAVIGGGVLAGGKLMQTSKVNALFENIGTIRKALTNFQKIYDQLPGDMYNPEDFFEDNTINGDPTTTKGNADGFVFGYEGIYAFQHLALAGMLEGNFNGTWQYENMFHGPMNNSILYFISTANDPVRLVVAKAGSSSGNLNVNNRTQALFSVAEMMEIENKFDNGKPNSGLIIAKDGSDVAAESCVTSSGDFNQSNLNNNQKVCYFEVRIIRGFYSPVN